MKKVSKKNCWRPRLGSGYLKQSPIQSNLSKSTPNLLRIPGSNQSKLVLWVPLPSTVSDFFFFFYQEKKTHAIELPLIEERVDRNCKANRNPAEERRWPRACHGFDGWIGAPRREWMNEWMIRNDGCGPPFFCFIFFRFFSFFFFALIDRVSDGCNFRVLGVDHISILFVIDINEHRKIQQTNFQSSIEIKVSFPNRNSRQIDFRVHVKYRPVNK